MKNKPFVGVVPYDLRKTKNLAELPINKLWCSENQQQSDKKIKDLTKFDHIVIYPHSSIYFSSYHKLNCNVSLVIAEPKVIHKRYYNKLWLLRHKFYTIFTCYKALANKYPNVIATPVSGLCIKNPNMIDFTNKNKLISIIASAKKLLTGHQLRHQIIKEITDKNIDVLGRGYVPFEDKKDGLLPYYFSIVIENCQEVDYFTEKLSDCFVCETVPIYWGCPNIGDYFNLDGMIIFQTIEELQIILDNLTKNHYQNFKVALKENSKTARKLANTNKVIADALILFQAQK